MNYKVFANKTKKGIKRPDEIEFDNAEKVWTQYLKNIREDDNKSTRLQHKMARASYRRLMFPNWYQKIWDYCKYNFYKIRSKVK